MTEESKGTKSQRCRIRVLIRARGNEYGGYVLKMSEQDMQLSTDEVAGIWTGDAVEVIGREFGPVSGKAQWRAPGHLRVKFMENTAIEAGLRDLWRYAPSG